MIMNAKRDDDRSLLRFVDLVKLHFALLESRGFRCTHTEPTLVRFESPELGINIYHGRQSYEISLEIENVRSSESYSLSEILRLVQNGRVEQYRVYATHTEEGVAEGVQELADRFLKCIDTGILVDSELFSRLKLQRENWARVYALETRLEQARNKSELAWQKGDFYEVVRVLGPLQEHLGPSDLRKLEYAKKHSNDST